MTETVAALPVAGLYCFQSDAHALAHEFMVEPPFTSTTAPVIKDASSDTRKSTTAAISSGVPYRPIGTPRVSVATASGDELPSSRS
jgi:hypothetical protein